MTVRSRSNERLKVVLLDWTRRFMQLAALATVLAVVYLVWGFFSGGASEWATLNEAARTRIATNVNGGIHILNVSLAILLLTCCILYLDEEALGYGLLAGACFLYFGIPYLIGFTMPDSIAEWERSKNQVILALLAELRLAGMLLAVPGLVLALRDMVMRITDGSRRKRDELTAMQYGGGVEEEKPVRPAIVGALAACWQLPFCREFIRLRCPIYHRKTRCWRQRVGCMCEENVIRTAMAEMMAEAEQEETDSGPVDFASPVDDGRRIDLGTGRPIEKTRPVRRPRPIASVPRNQVRIPHNPNIPMSKKKERCRNCVIFNEHQRLKYQLLAPLVVLVIPVAAVLEVAQIQGMLGGVLKGLDNLMQRLSLSPTTSAVGLENIANQELIAQYAIIGCLVMIVTTAMLRFLEHCMFRLKV